MSQRNNIIWQWLNFSELDADKLYEILQLREAVFQLEQNALYKDIDNFDKTAMHCVGELDRKLCAYARVREEYGGVTIERVVTDETCRGKGVGRELVTQALKYIDKNYQDFPIIISAQERLKKFYNSFGFVEFGSPFDDAGVMHIKMQISPR